MGYSSSAATALSSSSTLRSACAGINSERGSGVPDPRVEQLNDHQPQIDHYSPNIEGQSVRYQQSICTFGSGIDA